MSEQFVILLRHGVAEAKGGPKADFDRQLTVAGDREMKKVARAVASLFAGVDAIYSSPFVRCVETAERLWKAYRKGVLITMTKALAPGAHPSDMQELLHQSRGRRIICVGHEPGLSMLMLELTKMKSDSGITLKKGGCYGIRCDGDHGHLEWMLAPAILL